MNYFVQSKDSTNFLHEKIIRELNIGLKFQKLLTINIYYKKVGKNTSLRFRKNIRTCEAKRRYMKGKMSVLVWQKVRTC